MTSPCGLNCFHCPAHPAMEDDEQRAHRAEIMGKPLEQAFCRGCRSEGGAISLFGRTEPCAVWTCIRESAHEHCCECTDFPRDGLRPYADRAAAVPHNTAVFHLCLIKRTGVERRATDKAKNVRDAYFPAPFGSRGGT